VEEFAAAAKAEEELAGMGLKQLRGGGGGGGCCCCCSCVEEREVLES
jgi:hypothetical protein